MLLFSNIMNSHFALHFLNEEAKKNNNNSHSSTFYCVYLLSSSKSSSNVFIFTQTQSFKHFFFFRLFIFCRCSSAFIKYLGTIEELKLKPVDQIPPEESIIIPAPNKNVINPRKLGFFAFSSVYTFDQSIDHLYTLIYVMNSFFMRD